MEPVIRKQPDKPEEVLSTSASVPDDDMRQPFIDWLKEGKLPGEKLKAKAFRMKASKFSLINKTLFK